MDIDFVIQKTCEYSSRALAEYFAGNHAGAKKFVGTTLALLRMQSRIASADVNSLRETIRSIERNKKKLSQDGVEIPMVDARLKKLWQEWHRAESVLAGIGETMHYALDAWQIYGATFEDLCCLCNCDPKRTREMIGEDMKEPFSTLAMAYNMDYKDPRNTGWLEDCVDAPLTHALKAYLRDVILHSETGRAAARSAMEKCFPGIMENALTEVTDAEGNRCLINKDGEVVAILGEEHGYEK